MKKLDSIALKILMLQVAILVLAVLMSWGSDGMNVWGNVVGVDVLFMGLLIASRVAVNWAERKHLR